MSDTVNMGDLIRDFINGDLDMEGEMVAGFNDNNESVLVVIGEDRMKISTAQNNGWIKINYVYKDGTFEEMFEK